MKLILWSFIKRHAILRKIFFWIFSVMGMSVKANALYSCKPCPNGLHSNPEARSSSECFNPRTKTSKSTVLSNTTQNASGALMPGWYRISIRGDKGKDVSCTSTYNPSKKTSTYGTMTASGASGGVKFYVFYVKAYATYTYNYNNGSPKFILTENGKKMTFSANKGGDASCSSKAYSSKVTNGTYCVCSNGKAGSADVEGLFSNTFVSSNIDGLGSVGIKLTKL